MSGEKIVALVQALKPDPPKTPTVSATILSIVDFHCFQNVSFQTIVRLLLPLVKTSHLRQTAP